MTATVEVDTYLWQLRMGHINMKEIYKLPLIAAGVGVSLVTSTGKLYTYHMFIRKTL